MTTKIIGSKTVNCGNHQANKKFLMDKGYGKPTKPRCSEPSMFEILSWKDEDKEQQENKSYQIRQRQNRQYEEQKPELTKKIMQCKSLPSDQFLGSKNSNNLLSQPNFRNSCGGARNDNMRAKNQSNQTEHVLKQPRKSQSLKKTSNSTKYMESSKQINMGDNLNQAINLDQFTKENRKSGHQEKEQAKTKKLRKKTFQTNVDGQNKPRYMEAKKSAVQKLMEGPQFDQEKFDKMKVDEIKRFKQTSRDLSNTAFLTYFNRPPFQNYGRANKHCSGVLYGDYMYSHNVYPHTGDNHPQKQQTYITALTRAKSAGNIRPHPPMTRHLEEKLISSYLTLTQIYPKDTQIHSIPIKNPTVLEKLPMFNYVRFDTESFKKYSPFLNPTENQEFFTVENHYLKRHDIPKYFSNKEEIEGKQITYSKKISPGKKQL